MARKAIDDDRDPFKLIEGICDRSGGQAIVVEFVMPTDADLNPRWRAKAAGGTTIVVYADDRLDARQNATRAAVILCERLEWDPRELVMGGLPSPGGWVFTLQQKHREVASAAKYRAQAAANLTARDMEAESDFSTMDYNTDGVPGRVFVVDGDDKLPIGAWVEMLIWVSWSEIEGA